MEIDKNKLEKIVQLYFLGASLKEAIDIVDKNKDIDLEEIKISRGWKYQQLKLN